MADFGFVGPSYEAPSIYQDAQECINFYGEVDTTKPQGSRGYVALYPTPGLTKILELDGDIYGNQAVRGMRALSGGEWLLVVVGPNVYAINQAYTATKIGTLTTTTGYVSITDTITSNNGLTAYIVDGENRYAWIAGTSTTVTLHYQISSNKMYVSEIPDGNLYVGLSIGSYGTITAFGSGTGGIGTYTMSSTNTAGTVTALTTIKPGTGFTTLPILTIATPTANYGTIAVASCNSLKSVSPWDVSIVSGGTGYTVNDELTVSGGTGTAVTLVVTKVSAGVITEVLPLTTGNYSAIPTNPVSVTGGTGSSATFNLALYAGGSGYAVNDVLTASGGTATTAATYKVTQVDGSGVIKAVTLVGGGSYTSLPTNPVTMTGGTGTGASLNLYFGLNNSFTITNNGSFYNAAPDVTIEGGIGGEITTTATTYITATQSLPAWLQMPTTDGPWTGATVCDVIDNYVVYNEQGTQNWAATDLGYVVSQNAYYGTKDGAPDPIVSIIVDHRQVYLIGQNTTEVWVDVGSTISGIVSFPFQRVSGTMMQHGCAAPFSIARFGESFMFVTRDQRGQAMIGGITGYAFTRVSTHAVEQTLMNQNISDAIAYTYQLEGHEFYVVTFPSIDLTWVYDMTTQTWHKWLSFDPETGYYRHRSNCGAFFNNVYLVGDFENGKIYQLDNENYTEDGTYIRRLRRAPHLVTDLQRQYFSEMQIQFQPGVGLQTGQGNDPQAMLRWSNDGGSTWSNEHWTTIGRVGRYQNRAIWRRLGWSRDRIYEVSMSDPVRTVIISANLKAEVGDN